MPRWFRKVVGIVGKSPASLAGLSAPANAVFERSRGWVIAIVESNVRALRRCIQPIWCQGVLQLVLAFPAIRAQRGVVQAGTPGVVERAQRAFVDTLRAIGPGAAGLKTMGSTEPGYMPLPTQPDPCANDEA